MKLFNKYNNKSNNKSNKRSNEIWSFIFYIFHKFKNIIKNDLHILEKSVTIDVK